MHHRLPRMHTLDMTKTQVLSAPKVSETSHKRLKPAPHSNFSRRGLNAQVFVLVFESTLFGMFPREIK